MSSFSPLIPILITVGSLLLCIVIVVPVVRTAMRKAGERLRAELGGGPILRSDPMVNYFGVRSQGVGLRGNGPLMLTADKLGFMLALGNREPLIIPRGAIIKVETLRSHLGKTIARPLLGVHFTNDAGETDLVAFYVRDLNGWLAALSRG